MYQLNGINHLLIACRSMQETLPFYQDILGMKVVATAGGEGQARKESTLWWDDSNGPIDAIERIKVNRLYFLEFGLAQLAIAEIPDWEEKHEKPLFLPLLWPGAGAPTQPAGVDHLAFGVESREAVLWFQKRLRDHDIPVSALEESNGRLYSIYFYSPTGLALEIASFNPNPPPATNRFNDPDPVPALRVQ